MACNCKKAETVKPVFHCLVPQCPNCCRKHISRALAYLNEIWRHPVGLDAAIGELSLAEDHIRGLYPAFSSKIYAARFGIEQAPPVFPDLTELLTELKLLRSSPIPGHAVPQPAITPSVPSAPSVASKEYGSLLTEILSRHKVERTDIHEHLQTIHDTVVNREAQVCVELGTRSGESTIGFLCGLSRTGGHLWSCDLNDCPQAEEKVRRYGFGDRWTLIKADDIAWVKTWNKSIDVLLIDSSHLLDHTLQELRLFSIWVKRGGIILMHDTVTFPPVAEAIRRFLSESPAGAWHYENCENNNGLGILSRISEPKTAANHGDQVIAQTNPMQP